LHNGENPEVRIAYFREYGFKTLILWEHELKDTGAVIRKIQEFCEDNEIVHPSMKIGEQGVLESIMVPLSSNAEAISSLSRGTLNSNAGESRARKARKWKK